MLFHHDDRTRLGSTFVEDDIRKPVANLDLEGLYEGKNLISLPSLF
jgi:hypothetical protein